MYIISHKHQEVDSSNLILQIILIGLKDALTSPVTVTVTLLEICMTPNHSTILSFRNGGALESS